MKASHLQMSLLLAVLVFAAFWAAGGSGEAGTSGPLHLDEDAVQDDRALKSGPRLAALDEQEKVLPMLASGEAKVESAREVVAVSSEVQTMDVLVRARRTGSRDSEPGIPGVRLRISFTKLVTAKSDGPDAVEVASSSPEGWEGAEQEGNPGALVQYVTTGSDGSCVITIPRPDGATSGGRPVLTPRVTLPKDSALRVSISRYSLQEREGKLMLALDVTVSAMLSGHVVDITGNPQAGYVELYQQQENGDWWHRGDGKVGSDGTFEFPVRKEGMYVVRAVPGAGTSGRRRIDVRREFERLSASLLEGVAIPAPAHEVGGLVGQGNGVSSRLAVQFASVPKDVRIVVDGQGILWGRVVDRTGAPVSGARLLISHRDVDGDGRTSFKRGVSQVGSSSEEQPSIELWGRGAWGGEATTDKDGVFELLGLRPGEFVVRAHPDGSTQVFSKVLTWVPVPANGRPLELELTHPRVRIHLVDPDGEPMRDDWRWLKWDENASMAELFSGSAANLELSIVLVKGEADGSLGGEQVAPRYSGDGIYEVLPPGNSTIEISVIGNGYPQNVQRVAVPKDGGLIEVTVVVDRSLIVSDS